MEFVDALLRVGAQVQLWIAGERRLEFAGHQLSEVAAHALGHAALGLAGDPNEQADLQPEGDTQEQDEPEADAPIQAARKRPARLRHQRTCIRCPRP